MTLSTPCPCLGTGAIRHGGTPADCASLEICDCPAPDGCPTCRDAFDEPDVCAACGTPSTDLVLVDVTERGDVWRACPTCRRADQPRPIIASLAGIVTAALRGMPMAGRKAA